MKSVLTSILRAATSEQKTICRNLEWGSSPKPTLIWIITFLRDDIKANAMKNLKLKFLNFPKESKEKLRALKMRKIMSGMQLKLKKYIYANSNL